MALFNGTTDEKKAVDVCLDARGIFKECFFEAKSVFGNIEPAELGAKESVELCIEARSGFDQCRLEAEKAFPDARQLIETCAPAKEKGFNRCYGEVSVFQNRKEAVQTCRAAGERFGQCYVLIKDSLPKLQAAEKCALPEPKEEEE